MKPKRLFLIAGYNTQNKLDAALVYMLKELHVYGDIILAMDNDVPEPELNKVSSYTLHIIALRHKEYDFGSYKRAYAYASEKELLNNYDFVYMINDSVYGPLFDIGKTFQNIESFNTDAFGLVCNPHKRHPHIQSWFIGMKPSVFAAQWFKDFIESVTKQKDKGSVTCLYEQGFTKLLEKHNKTWKCQYSVSGRGIYNKIKKLYNIGIPFIKKVAFTRHNGALGRQIEYVLNKCSTEARIAIISSAKESFGSEYTKWLLTKNPIKIIYRNVTYFILKLKKREI